MMMRLGKATTSGLLCSGVLLAAMNAQANQQIAQVPLSLSEGVPPNMILTLDESGSMSWSFVPDASSTTTSVYSNKIGGYNTRRMRAANTNPMAYNPHVIYDIPPTFAQDGSEIELTTSFTNAPLNGFWLSADWSNTKGNILRDLSNNYRLAREHRQGAPDATNGGSLNWAPHPDDFNYKEITGIGQNTTYTFGPDEDYAVQVKVTRTSSSKCTAELMFGAGAQSVLCSLNGSTATVYDTYNKNNKTYAGLINKGVPAYYYEFEPSYKRTANGAVGSCGTFEDDSGTGKDAFSQDERCYRLVWVDETSAYDEKGNRLKHPNGQLVDGKQNFAIWYSFYRSRALATLSAAKIAFYNLSPDVRFTWQDLDTCKTFESDSGNTCGNNKLKPYSVKHRGEFYTWLRKRYFNKGTPLPAAMKRAGDFLKTAAPWQKTPYANTGNDDANTYACRPSYHVMMTDGMWNATTTNPSSFRSDHTTFTTPSGEKYGVKDYDQNKPFYDNAGNSTLADLAMHYWATDLNTSLDNKIRPYIPYKNDDSDKEYWDPRNNPAEWQSMSNFIMALGLTTSLGTGSNSNLPWAGSTHGGEGYAELLQGTSWPKASSGSANNVYDLWHAAINSRGEFYSVDSPEAMVQAFNDILTRIADRKASAAMPGLSVSLESDGAGEDAADRLATYYYQTSFDSADGWTGEIQKTKSYRQWNDATRQFETVVEAEWKASEKLSNQHERKIKMANEVGNALVSFTTDEAGQALKHALSFNPDPGKQSGAYTWEDRLNYIRGSREHEGVEEGKMRRRASLLGDFLSSQPVVVSGARYLAGFSNRLEGNTAYTTFMTSIANRSPMLYVGGNAGMLHAFDAATGVEKFAFVPTAVFSKLNKLTGHNYSHEYYVDGTPVIADAFDGTNWRTILVGTLRAGGKGLFALDITDPANISLLWELHENSNEAEDLDVKPGYSFSKPTVARLHNGKWAVVTGNGYEGDGSNNGAASLYIIDAFSGEMIEELTVQSEAIGSNGLSTPRLVDFDSDGVADYAYAGDLHGNLWRFDLLGAGANPERTDGPIYGDKTGGTSGFKVSYGGKPMFIAKTANTVNGSNVRQPITSAPSIVRHPTRTGYLVVFGTGRYLYQGDKAGETSHAQSLYGIWDAKTKAETTSSDTISASGLASQSIAQQTTGTGKTTGVSRTTRVISENPVKWNEKRGWRLDLQVGSKREGEMMIEEMRVLGNTLFIQTLVPNADPCGNGADNWLYAINPATGGKTLHHAFDTRGANNVIMSGIKFGSEGGISIGQDEAGFKANAPGDQEPIAPDSSSMGRQSWRMIDDA